MPSNPIARSSESPIESKQSTPEKPFTPTPHMLIWLDTVLRNDTPVIEEIARRANMDESTWYKWLEKPGFLDWFETERHKRIRAHGWRLDNIGLKNSNDDFRFWETMMKRVGNIKDGSDVTNNITMPIQVVFKKQ